MQLTGGNMVKTTKMLREELSGYHDRANKIARMVRDAKIVPVVRGLYETDAHASPWPLAACIYGPSYISFESALAFYGLIPEGVRAITSATFEKGRAQGLRNALRLVFVPRRSRAGVSLRHRCARGGWRALPYCHAGKGALRYGVHDAARRQSGGARGAPLRRFATGSGGLGRTRHQRHRLLGRAIPFTQCGKAREILEGRLGR